MTTYTRIKFDLLENGGSGEHEIAVGDLILAGWTGRDRAALELHIDEMEKLGIKRYELIHTGPNIHMGCAILRYYLRYERNDVRKALARYNGSVGHRNYPDLVISRWSRWNGADDLGFPTATPIRKAH